MRCWADQFLTVVNRNILSVSRRRRAKCTAYQCDIVLQLLHILESQKTFGAKEWLMPLVVGPHH